MALEVGSVAPEFELASQSGERVRLSELCRERVVVLFFYPKDDTPGCTAEACSFRDQYDAFVEAGAEVVGVSADPIDRHRRFAEKHGLPFRILSDRDKSVRRAYQVKDSVPLLLPGRETFVIDRRRRVRHRFSSQIDAMRHIDEALAVVQRLAARESES